MKDIRNQALVVAVLLTLLAISLTPVFADVVTLKPGTKVPTLQQVTTAGNTTSNPIVIDTTTSDIGLTIAHQASKYFAAEHTLMFDNDAYSFGLYDDVGDQYGIQFMYVPVVSLFGGAFVTDALTMLSFRESATDNDGDGNVDPLGAFMNFVDKNGDTVMNVTIQSTFQEHRFALGSDQSNPQLLPWLNFNDTGDYNEELGTANVQYSFKYDPNVHMLRGFGASPPGGQGYNYPLPGLILGGFNASDPDNRVPTSVSQHGLGSNDVIIAVSEDGTEGGDFEVQGNSFFKATTLDEVDEPATPSENSLVLFARDDGSGNTQLCVKFSNGTVTVLATE